jgi:hypothetical protein
MQRGNRELDSLIQSEPERDAKRSPMPQDRKVAGENQNHNQQAALKKAHGSIKQREGFQKAIRPSVQGCEKNT